MSQMNKQEDVLEPWYMQGNHSSKLICRGFEADNAFQQTTTETTKEMQAKTNSQHLKPQNNASIMMRWHVAFSMYFH